MRWSPVINAVAATAYITLIGTVMHFVMTLKHDTPDTIFDPIAVISLFVFSAAVMAFLFFYRPAILLTENKKKEAIDFFFKTLATFGVLTLIAIGLVLLY